MKRLNWPALLVLASTFLSASLCSADLSGSLEEKQIVLRIKPEAEVNVEIGQGAVLTTAKPAAVADIGKQRYEEVCHICHGSGLAGAPKLGDKAEWDARLAEGGIEILVKRALQGYKAMPPKGTCINCSDEEIRKAIEYMLSQSK